MTLNEAIIHAKEVAEKNRKQYKNCPADRKDIEHQTCEKCAEEHEQLARWLEDYKRLSTEKEQDIYERAYKDGYDKGYDQGHFNGYREAIDNFAKWLENKKYLMKEILEYDFCYTHYDELKANYVITEYFEEQIKEGV